MHRHGDRRDAEEDGAALEDVASAGARDALEVLEVRAVQVDGGRGAGDEAELVGRDGDDGADERVPAQQVAVERAELDAAVRADQQARGGGEAHALRPEQREHRHVALRAPQLDGHLDGVDDGGQPAVAADRAAARRTEVTGLQFVIAVMAVALHQTEGRIALVEDPPGRGDRGVGGPGGGGGVERRGARGVRRALLDDVEQRKDRVVVGQAGGAAREARLAAADGAGEVAALAGARVDARETEAVGARQQLGLALVGPRRVLVVADATLQQLVGNLLRQAGPAASRGHHRQGSTGGYAHITSLGFRQTTGDMLQKWSACLSLSFVLGALLCLKSERNMVQHGNTSLLLDDERVKFLS